MEWPPAWAMLVSALGLSIYVYSTWHHDYFKTRNIPFVKPKPFVGNLGSFIFLKESFGDVLIRLYNNFKGNSIAGYFERMSRVFLVLDPEIIGLIAVKDFDYFTDHRSLVREDSDPLFGKNMLSLRGQRWKDMRHTLSPAFTSSKMRAMFPLVQETGVQLRTYLEKKCEGKQDLQDGLLTLELKDMFSRFASDVIASAAFGLQCDSLADPDNEFYRVGTDVVDFTGLNGFRKLGHFFIPKLMKLLNITLISKYSADFFRTIVHGIMETRERENIVRPDMIQLLMQAKKGTLKGDDAATGLPEEQGGKRLELSDDDVTANALLFFLAGFDTASTLLCFMSHLLAVHPDIQRRVQQEMDEVLRESDGKLTYEGIHKMKYLDCVISETLRLYPPSPSLDRQCTKWYTLSPTSTCPGVFIKEGDYISIPTIAIHRDAEFFPNPMKFDPARFSDENKHNIKPFTYMPFGLGPRTCIGMRFALMEAKVAMTSLLTRFDLEVVAKTTLPLVLNKGSINLDVEGGFWAGIRPRGKRS